MSSIGRMVIDQWPAAAGEGRNGPSVAPHVLTADRLERYDGERTAAGKAHKTSTVGTGPRSTRSLTVRFEWCALRESNPPTFGFVDSRRSPAQGVKNSAKFPNPLRRSSILISASRFPKCSSDSRLECRFLPCSQRQFSGGFLVRSPLDRWGCLRPFRRAQRG